MKDECRFKKSLGPSLQAKPSNFIQNLNCDQKEELSFIIESFGTCQYGDSSYALLPGELEVIHYINDSPVVFGNGLNLETGEVVILAFEQDESLKEDYFRYKELQKILYGRLSEEEKKKYWIEDYDEKTLEAELEALAQIFEAPGLNDWNELLDLYNYDNPLEVRESVEDLDYQDFLGKDYPQISYKGNKLELLEWPKKDKGYSEEFSVSAWKTGNVYTYRAKARNLKTNEVLNLVWEPKSTRPLMDIEIQGYDWNQEKYISQEDYD